MSRFVLVLVLVLGSSGCATTVTIDGATEADVFVTNPPGAKDFTYVGTGRPFKYKLPRDLDNQKIVVLVKTDNGSWKYTIFTDRDLAIMHPPKGKAVGIGAVEAVLPEDIPPTPGAAGAAKKKPASKPKPATTTDPEEPSATISPN